MQNIRLMGANASIFQVSLETILTQPRSDIRYSCQPFQKRWQWSANAVAVKCQRYGSRVPKLWH